MKIISPSAQQFCDGKEPGWMLLQPKDKPHKGGFKIVADEKRYIHWLKVVEHLLQMMDILNFGYCLRHAILAFQD